MEILWRILGSDFIDVLDERAHFGNEIGSNTRIAICIADRYTCTMAQLVTRIDEQLAEALDSLVEEGVVASRSEAVRIGLEELIDRHHRSQVGKAIADAYTIHPQKEDELGWSDAATEQMIADEPW